MRGQALDLSRPCVMGVLNVTPDSFSDGGDFFGAEDALRRAERMVEEGADIIDVGGESTRPGAAAVSVQEEIDACRPGDRGAQHPDSHADLGGHQQAGSDARRGGAGAGMINDVRPCARPAPWRRRLDAAVPVCLMHMQGQPRTMQEAPQYAM